MQNMFNMFELSCNINEIINNIDKEYYRHNSSYKEIILFLAELMHITISIDDHKSISYDPKITFSKN